MLTWNVTYHCKPGKRDAFYQVITELGVRANSRSEETSNTITSLTRRTPMYSCWWKHGRSLPCRRPTAAQRPSTSSKS